MSEHERCVCGREGATRSAWPESGIRIECSALCWCWWGPIGDTKEGAWAAWDRVMRAAREAQEFHEAAQDCNAYQQGRSPDA